MGSPSASSWGCCREGVRDMINADIRYAGPAKYDSGGAGDGQRRGCVWKCYSYFTDSSNCRMHKERTGRHVLAVVLPIGTATFGVNQLREAQ